MTDWSKPGGGSAVGHAAIGFIHGQRLHGSIRPEHVEIRYERDGEVHHTVALRESHAQQVEFSDADTFRVWTPEGTEVIADKLLAARPLPNDD